MFNKFDDEVIKVISNSKYEMNKFKHPYLGSEHLMLGLLKNKNIVSETLDKYKINYNIFYNEVLKITGIGSSDTSFVLYTPVVREIFDRAIDISMEENIKVNVEILFVSIIEVGGGIAEKVFNNLNFKIDKLYNEFIFKIPKKNKKKKTIIDEIGYEYTKKDVVDSFEPVIGREKEIIEIIEILSRKNKSNPLLIGDAGVGKSAIIEEIGKRIVYNNIPSKLRGKRIIKIDMSVAVAGTKYRGEFEEKINKIINCAEEDENIILFIDEIHTIVGAGGAEGAIDASNILKPALARGKIKCIGATTIDEYKRIIEKDKALARRFKKIIIEEPNIKQVRNILFKIKPIYENFHHVSISNKLLNSIILLSNKYIKNSKNPDKTIDILDEVCSHASVKENDKIKEYNLLLKNINEIIDMKKNEIKKKNFNKAYEYKKEENKMLTRLNELDYILATTNYINVTKKDVYDVISSRIKIPINYFNNNSLFIEQELNKKIYGQKTAIKKIVNTYNNLKNSDRLISMLFTGKTGVGKTFTALEFAKCITKNVIKLDMREYTDAHSINKIIGVPLGFSGHDNSDYLFDKVRDNPFSVIIFDGVENCHSSILELLFQIIENNERKDVKGNIISFENCIFIMIDNNFNNSKIGFNYNSKINDYFTNEYNYKFDNIIYFNELSPENIRKILYSKINDKNLIDKIMCKLDYKKNGIKNLDNIIKKYKKSQKIKKISKIYSKI